MPRIQISDVTGRPYQIDSSDPEMVAKWLWETLPRVGPTHVFPAQIRMWPLYDANDKPDWPTEIHVFAAGTTPEANVRGVIEVLQRFAAPASIELEEGEGHE